MDESGTRKGTNQSEGRPSGEVAALSNTPGDLFWEMNKPGAAFEQNVVGIVVVRADGTIAYINTYFASLIGELSADLVDKQLLDFAAEQDKPKIAEVVTDCVSGKHSFVQFESTVTHKSGNTVDIFINASTAVFEGQPAAIGVVIDISARKQAEQALAGSEAKLQAALSNMSQGLLMLDAEGRLVLFNSRVAEIYGLPLEQIKEGMTVPELLAKGPAATGVSDVAPEATLAELGKAFRDPAGGAYVQHLTDGRNIAASFRPMPNGGIVVTIEDITEKLQAEEKIRHLAQFDALTNLPNRVSFYDQMDTLMKHLRRAESVGVLSLDLDRFKAVNDTFGHPTGDLLLQAAARRMQSCLREGDIAARLGGDEFAILQIPGDHATDITALANRLIEVVGAPYDFNGNQVIVGVSVGVAIAPVDGKEPDTLMKNADLALYRAKADGGSVCRFFEPEMDARMQARRVIELDLRQAIRNGDEFELLFQPLVDVKSGKVKSCEALLRWNNPERGLVMPDDFIPVAEATGLIVPLGEWVLRQGCKEAMRWPEEITVAINVSPVQFKSKTLVQSIKNALAESGLPASRLEIEITEQVLMNESEGAFAILHEIRDLGIKISMDDFGIGYSSIGYLRSFPFSTIKIDESFIRDLPSKQDSLAIVRAVVGLSSSLGIQTIAEGVETEEQLASVTSEGCNSFQGFVFSEPRPGAEIEQFFKAHADGAVAAFPASEEPKVK